MSQALDCHLPHASMAVGLTALLIVLALCVLPAPVLAASPLLETQGALLRSEAGAVPNNPERQEGAGWLEHRKGLRIVHLQGSSYAMGYQHGVLLRQEIIQMLQLQNTLEAKPASLPGRVMNFLSSLYQRTFVLARIKRDIPLALLDEIKGIAAGVGTAADVDSLLLLQFTLEGLQPGGSTFVAMRNATQTGGVLHGFNLDGQWPALFWDLATVFVYKPDEGESFVSISWPGMVGVVQGMNATGLSLSFNSILPDSDAEVRATPGMLLAREALQHATQASEVLETFRGWPRQAGAAVTVATSSNEAAIIEYNSQRISARKPEGDLLLTTSYFASPALLPLTRNWHDAGDEKYDRLSALLTSSQGKLSVASAIGILRDRYDPYTQQESPYELSINNMQTITSVLFSPAQRTLWIAKAGANAPAPYNQYVTLSLLDELSGKKEPVVADVIASPLLDSPTAASIGMWRRAYQSSTQDPDQWDTVAKLLEKAVNLDHAPVPLFYYGVALARLGKLLEAAKTFEQAAQNPQAHPYWQKRSLMYLGWVYDNEGQRSLAASTYKKALGIHIARGAYSLYEKTLNEEIQRLMNGQPVVLPAMWS